MKRVLFVSYFFYPDNAIGAVRSTKILKYLSKSHNFSCDVLTIENDAIKDYFDANQVYYTNKFVIKTKSKNLGKISIQKKQNFSEFKKNSIKLKNIKSKLRKIKNFLNQYIIFYKSKKTIKKMDIMCYDAIFSTYGPSVNHLIGRFVKKLHKNIIWIADFRDPVYVPQISLKILKNYEEKYANRVCRMANYITVVSKGYSKALKIENTEKLRIIYNGFDKDDILDINTEKFQKFTISYFGNLYEGMRDLTPVIQSINELVSDAHINIDDIQFLYAGNSACVLYNQLKQYGMESLIQNKGYVSKAESLEMQKRSHILLLPTWNQVNYEGVIPGKFYEYLISEVPIVAVVVGNKANSEISELIYRTNSGICYEAANHENDYKILKNTILKYYKAFLNNSTSAPKLHVSEIEKFNYSNISREVYSLINQSVKKKL